MGMGMQWRNTEATHIAQHIGGAKQLPKAWLFLVASLLQLYTLFHVSHSKPPLKLCKHSSWNKKPDPVSYPPSTQSKDVGNNQPSTRLRVSSTKGYSDIIGYYMPFHVSTAHHLCNYTWFTLHTTFLKSCKYYLIAQMCLCLQTEFCSSTSPTNMVTQELTHWQTISWFTTKTMHTIPTALTVIKFTYSPV